MLHNSPAPPTSECATISLVVAQQRFPRAEIHLVVVTQDVYSVLTVS